MRPAVTSHKSDRSVYMSCFLLSLPTTPTWPLPHSKCLTRPKCTTSDRTPLPFASCFWLGTVEDLEELGNTVSHARVHVCLGAFDVVVQVVTEELDAGDGREGEVLVGKVAWCKDWC